MSGLKRVLSVLCVAVLLGGVAFAGDDLKAGGRELAKKHGAAIVPVKIVSSLQITRNGQAMPARENEAEVFATVLDATGLMVTSNLAADPAGAVGSSQPGIQVESNIKSARLIQPDGTERALKIVLRDKDLDLMFLRPEKPATLTHVNMGKTGPELNLMDDLLVLSRLGAIGDREVKVSLSTIEAVITKPRRFYVTNFIAGMTALGCPAFDSKGQLAGVMVMRVQAGASSDRLPVVLPVADIAEDAAQIEPPDKE
jgi:hypothetical protein